MDATARPAPRTLHGRGREVATGLRHLHCGIRAGEGRVLCLSGPDGTGRSALHDALVEQSRRRGWLVASAALVDPRSASGSGRPGLEVSPAYSALAATLWASSEPLLSHDEFVELEASHDRPVWLLDRLATALERRAEHQPLLIAIDDVQWTDHASLYALKTLPARLRARPVSWLFTSRSPGPQLDEIEAATAPAVPVLRLTPAPLSGTVLDAIVRERLGGEPSPALARMIRGCGGRPGLLVRLLDHLDAGDGGPAAGAVGHEVLPDAFVSGVRARITSDLDETTAAVLLTASVLGGFTLDDLAVAVGESPHRLVGRVEALLDGGYLVDDGPRLSFTLEVVRAAAYASIPESLRRLTHRSAARHLAQEHRPAGEIAPHLCATAERGDLDAVALLRRAADEEGDVEASLTLLRRARQLVHPSEPLHDALTGQVIGALCAASRFTAAIEEQAAGTSPSPAAFVAAAPALWMLGRHDEVRAQARRWSTAEPEPLSHERVAAIERAVAARTGAPADGAPRRPTAEDAVAAAWEHRAAGLMSLSAGRPEDAARSFRAAASGLGIVPEELWALLEGDDLSLAERWLHGHAEAAAADEGLHDLLLLGWSMLHLLTGSLDRAAGEAEQSAAAAAAHGRADVVLGARDVLARVALLRGAVGEAAALGATSDDSVHDAPAAAWTGLVRAMVSSARGDHHSAAVRVASVLAERPAACAVLENLVVGHRIALRAGDGRLLRDVSEKVALRASGVSTTSRAVSAYLHGLEAHDVDAVAAADAALVGSDRAVLRARVAADLGRLLLDSGRRSDGVAALDRSWELYSQAGATGAADAVRRSLRQAGIRRRGWPLPTPRATFGWGSLTESEERVALLVADGLSNREVAAELVVSPNTVATHLRAVYAKLGVSKRVQLARLVMDQAS